MDSFHQGKPEKVSQSRWRLNGETSFEGIERTSQEMLPSVAVGDRFRPNGEELVDYYLKRSILGLGYDGNDLPIAQVNVYKFEPCQLPGYSKIQSNDQEWYFISPLEYMDKKRTRFNRKTKTGTWKPTGKKLPVLKRGSKKVIGSKRTLVFHKKGQKTEWVMHEYRYISDSDQSNAGEFVAVKLKRNFDDKIMKSKSNDRPRMNCDYENVDSTCNDGAPVSAHCESQSHNDNGMCLSTSSSDIQSSITDLELELENSEPNTPTPFLFEDEEASPDQDTPESLPVTVVDDVPSPVKELKDSVCTIPKMSSALDGQSFVKASVSDDQSFVKATVLDDQPCISVVGDWREDNYLEEWMNETVFTPSKMALQTEPLATLSEILDLF